MIPDDKHFEAFGKIMYWYAAVEVGIKADLQAEEGAGLEGGGVEIGVGLTPHILSDAIEGEAREVAKVHAALAREIRIRNRPFTRPAVLLSGGETTVTIRPQVAGTPKGRGGRAVEGQRPAL